MVSKCTLVCLDHPPTHPDAVSPLSALLVAAADVADTYQEQQAALMGDADEEIPKDRSKGKDSMTPLEQQVDEIVAASLASKGCLLDAEGMVEIGPPNDGSAAPRRKAHKRNKGPGGSASRSGLGGGASRSRATQGGSVATSTSSKESNRIGTSRSSVGGGLSSAHSAGGQTSSSDAWADAKEGRDVMVARESARVLSSRALLLSLRTVERAIQQNSYHSRHRLYRCVWEFFAQQMSLAVGAHTHPSCFLPHPPTALCLVPRLSWRRAPEAGPRMQRLWLTSQRCSWPRLPPRTVSVCRGDV